MATFNLISDGVDARAAARRACALLTARLEAASDPVFFSQALTGVVGEVIDDPTAVAYLLFALSTMAMTGFALAAEETGVPVGEVWSAAARSYETEWRSL